MEINRLKIGVEFFIEDYLKVSFVDHFYHFLCNDLKVNTFNYSFDKYLLISMPEIVLGIQIILCPHNLTNHSITLGLYSAL